MMGKTGFKCPKCGQDEYFTASAVLLYNTVVLVHEDGYNWFDAKTTESEIPGWSKMRCERCEYEAKTEEFEEE